MLLSNNDGTYTAGPLDVLCILHDTTTGRYHAAFFEEAPFPGPRPEVFEGRAVRLKSKMHHTTGAASLAGAQAHLDDMAKMIAVPPENLWLEPKPWDGEIGIVWMVPNWRTGTPTR